ncbi:GNAT family N-acetyltransferase [bacterium]|nr:GNAT family N-acetyltransferase [bacterium]
MNQNEKEKLKERLLFSNGDLHVYAGITKKEFPGLYEEIRKISEQEFNIENAYDKFDETYKYLVCIAEYNNPEELPLEKTREIVSFYRYILCKDAMKEDDSKDRINFDLSTNKFYDYSFRFKMLLPATLELGRSVVNHESKMAKKGLEAVWKGLGALIDYYSTKNKSIELLYGEVSLQKSRYHAGNICEKDSLLPIISCFIKNFGHDDLITPKKPNASKNQWLLVAKEMGFVGDFSKDSVMLRRLLKSQGTPPPQLFFHYANLAEQDGLAMYLPVDNELLNCWEMGLILRIKRIKSDCLNHFIPKDYNEQAFL